MRKFHSKCHTLIYISNLDILTRMVYNIKCNKKTPDLCVRVHTHTHTQAIEQILQYLNDFYECLLYAEFCALFRTFLF